MAAERAERAPGARGRRVGLHRLLDPAVLADPYPLYRQLREEQPVYWDPFLHAWVVTRYDDVVSVLTSFSAACTPTPEQLAALGLEALSPVAEVLVRQMLFLDPPAHTRVRRLAAKAFTPKRVEQMRDHIRELVEKLLYDVRSEPSLDVIGDLGLPLPAIVSAEMLGLPARDWRQLTAWSRSFAEVIGNFQPTPERVRRVVQELEALTAYLARGLRGELDAGEGVLHALADAQVDGDRLTEEEVIANAVITMVGAQETTTNLIGNGVLTLLRRRDEWERLASSPALLPSAVEELLRFESPSQHTARMAFDDTELGGNIVRRGTGVIAVMGAANRDPERFAEPDRLDLERRANHHLAFGWAAHLCFGAALARIEGQEAFGALVRQWGDMRLTDEPLSWRPHLGLRGLNVLRVERRR
jgi:cytochrome P450